MREWPGWTLYAEKARAARGARSEAMDFSFAEMKMLFLVFPLLVFIGTYHCWTYCLFQGRMQMEAKGQKDRLKCDEGPVSRTKEFTPNCGQRCN